MEELFAKNNQYNSEPNQPAVMADIPTESDQKENGFGNNHEIPTEQIKTTMATALSCTPDKRKPRRSVLKEFDPFLNSPIPSEDHKQNQIITQNRFDTVPLKDSALLVVIDENPIVNPEETRAKSPDDYFSASEETPVKSAKFQADLVPRLETVEIAQNDPEDADLLQLLPLETSYTLDTTRTIGDTELSHDEIVLTETTSPEKSPILERSEEPDKLEPEKPKFEYKEIPISDHLEFNRKSLGAAETSSEVEAEAEQNPCITLSSSGIDSPITRRESTSPVKSPKREPEPDLYIDEGPSTSTGVRHETTLRTSSDFDIPLETTSSSVINVSDCSEIVCLTTEFNRGVPSVSNTGLEDLIALTSSSSLRSEEQIQIRDIQPQAILVPLPLDDVSNQSNDTVHIDGFDTGTFSGEHDDLREHNSTSNIIEVLQPQFQRGEIPDIVLQSTDKTSNKKMDYGDEVHKLHNEISELKLQLNGIQQHKASLELEIRQKEEIIIKSQAEALKNEQALKVEIKQLKEKLKENSKLIEKDSYKELEEQLKESKTREAKALSELNQKQKDEVNFHTVMKDMEKMLDVRTSEYQKQQEEYDTVKKHLSNLELAFSDVHSKYEKTKELLISMKHNEDILVQNLTEYQQTSISQDERYESLKSHAKGQIEKSNREIFALRQKYDEELSKLRAIIKRLEIKCSSLEVSLQQKTEECQQLSALCDEVTGKKV